MPMSLKAQDVARATGARCRCLKGIDVVAGDGLVTVIIGPDGASGRRSVRTMPLFHPTEGDVLHDGQWIDLAPEAI